MRSVGNLDSIKVIILISGSGTNMQNLVEKCHKRSIFEISKNIGFGVKNLDSSTLDSKALKSLLDKKVEIIEVISNKSGAFGLVRARNLGINTSVMESKGKSRDDFDRELGEYLQDLYLKGRMSFVLLAGFMRILGDAFFDILPKSVKILNIHPSLLPLHKGANGIKDSFFDRSDFGGVSVHYVSKELDSGEIILQERVAKIRGESLEAFECRVHKMEYEIYPKAFLLSVFQSFLLECYGR